MFGWLFSRDKEEEKVEDGAITYMSVLNREKWKELIEQIIKTKSPIKKGDLMFRVYLNDRSGKLYYEKSYFEWEEGDFTDKFSSEAADLITECIRENGEITEEKVGTTIYVKHANPFECASTEIDYDEALKEEMIYDMNEIEVDSFDENEHLESVLEEEIDEEEWWEVEYTETASIVSKGIDRQDVQELKKFCEWDEDRVYVLMALARSSENEEVTATNQPCIRKIVEDEEEFEEKIEQLERAVSESDTKYRLYMTVNARSVTDAFFQLRDEYDMYLAQILKGNNDIKRQLKRVDHNWKSVLMTPPTRAEKFFLVDLDDPSEEVKEALMDALEEETELLLYNESPNGHHIVCEPFNYTEFEFDADYEIKTDDMIFCGFLN